MWRRLFWPKQVLLRNKKELGRNKIVDTIVVHVICKPKKVRNIYHKYNYIFL